MMSATRFDGDLILIEPELELGLCLIVIIILSTYVASYLLNHNCVMRNIHIAPPHLKQCGHMQFD